MDDSKGQIRTGYVFDWVCQFFNSVWNFALLFPFLSTDLQDLQEDG